MLARYLIILCLAMCQTGNAQSYFNTVGARPQTAEKPDIQEKIDEEEGEKAGSNPFLFLPLEELEEMAMRYVHVRDSLRLASRQEHNREPGQKLYKGKSRKLSYGNLINVMEECGIRQPLYVLAQACLETGWFTSRVYREYNNLFGLYDSRKKDYYRFQTWEDSVAGYAQYVQYRYKGGDYLHFLRRVGYAEDPGYTVKVNCIAKMLMKYGYPHGHP